MPLRQYFEVCATSRSGLNVTKFLSEIIEVKLTEFQKLPIRPTLDGRAFNSPGQTTREDLCVHKRDLSPEDVQVILHLRFAEHIALAAIATRFGVGNSTIRRICEEFEQREQHNPSSVQPSASRIFEKWG